MKPSEHCLDLANIALKAWNGDLDSLADIVADAIDKQHLVAWNAGHRTGWLEAGSANAMHDLSLKLCDTDRELEHARRDLAFMREALIGAARLLRSDHMSITPEEADEISWAIGEALSSRSGK